MKWRELAVDCFTMLEKEWLTKGEYGVIYYGFAMGSVAVWSHSAAQDCP